ARRTDFRRGRSLGTRDHIVTWPKPRQRPDWMTHEQYQAFPDELMVRESRLHHRVLVTTMLDARKTSKQDL
ncbi:IS4 family transposase, partial [Paraburkholderia sp. 31.1]|nr:IS4 family transposase [Paraburkholderia sp. 31.1]MBC8726788.1 IS4 family transposase [Paraburkholderia sp. 31.1]MBC8726789.1 IS4 family transposase [Paraburkholderia sp. 31.1]